ncbi:12381_t:CDS:2, partial [Dentiscutata heterogama]
WLSFPELEQNNPSALLPPPPLHRPSSPFIKPAFSLPQKSSFTLSGAIFFFSALISACETRNLYVLD